MVSLGSWCLAGPHCPSMLTVITHGVSQHVEGLGGRTMERPLRTPPGSAQDASSQCPSRPPTQGDQTPREGATWGLPEPSPDTAILPFPVLTACGSGAGRSQAASSHGANARQAGHLWGLKQDPCHSMPRASANMSRVTHRGWRPKCSRMFSPRPRQLRLSSPRTGAWLASPCRCRSQWPDFHPCRPGGWTVLAAAGCRSTLHLLAF